MSENSTGNDSGDSSVRHWIEQHFDAKVDHFEKLPRWRPAWNVDITLNNPESGAHRQLKLHIRGERGEGLKTQPLDLEYRVLKLLAERGIPVPHIYGWIEQPVAIVMEYSAGEPYLGGADKDQALHTLVGKYMDILADIHGLDNQPFIDAGVKASSNWKDTALSYLSMAEETYLENKTGPDPLVEFVRRWLYRNVPDEPASYSFLVGDCPQFMHSKGTISAIYDLEMVRLGDPMFDLASIRVRDINEPAGDLVSLFKRYAKKRGVALNYQAIHFYSVLQFIAVPMISSPSLKTIRPHPAFIEYLSWSLSTIPRALESMADSMGVILATLVEIPEIPSLHSDALADMVAQSALLPDPGGFIREHPLLSLANYAKRADELGPTINRLDLEDISAVLNQNFTDMNDAEMALEIYVLAVGEEKDAELIQLFHSRAMRRLQFIKDYPSPIITQSLGAIR